MRIALWAVAGTLLGGALGWLIPLLFPGRAHGFDGLGLLTAQLFAAGTGATVGLILGGGLAARREQRLPNEREGPPAAESRSPRSELT